VDIEDQLLSQMIDNHDIVEDCLEEGLSAIHWKNYPDVFEALRIAVSNSQSHDILTLVSLFPEKKDKLISLAGTPSTKNPMYFCREMLARHNLEAARLATVEFSRYLDKRRPHEATEFFDEAKETLITALQNQDGIAPFRTLEPEAQMEQLLLSQERGDAGVYTPTGIAKLDERINGIYNGEYVLVIGRTSEGKTTLALNMTLNAAESGRKILFFSVEMDELTLWRRLICVYLKIPFKKLRNGHLTPEERIKFQETTKIFAQSDFRINARVGRDFNKVQTEIRRLNRKGKADYVVIDYIQQFRIPGFKGSRFEELTEISARIQHMTRQYNIPILGLAQLNRGAKKGEVDINDDSVLEFIKDCGALEQDASTVLRIGNNEQQTFVTIAKSKLDSQGMVLVDFNKIVGSIC
jgi:replicative DNA helicase